MEDRLFVGKSVGLGEWLSDLEWVRPLTDETTMSVTAATIRMFISNGFTISMFAVSNRTRRRTNIRKSKLAWERHRQLDMVALV